MEENFREAYAEVNEIINNLSNNYYEKIPEKVRNFFAEERDETYNPIIDVDKPLEEQGLKNKTLVILSILYVNYWCDSEDEKNEIIKQWADNDKRAEEELREKYNPDNLFKKKSETIEENVEVNESLQMVEYKKMNIFQKLIAKITRLFKK